ncbi:MAG: hypothetical protein [Vetruanivirus porcinprimi]|uniref:Uncharacterized protein n=1 Tax=phage Lak_Megaphage_RVC_AP1_GC26 TaxID=3109224 RepID=A0ABZ0Z6D1_9CAUD|nr:MAG: hypothetical protein [phage Lak_Megaphage_RVC_AP1_GC26]
METNRTVIDKIKYLYKRLYKTELFSSTLTVCMNERDDFYEYSREHQPEFKIAMMELLMHPDEMNARIPFYCCYILHDDDFIKLYENKNDKLPLNEDYVWDECNLWLNYFKSTKDIDYYKDYKEYKRYLNLNFKPFNPFTDKDPNPTYEEYIRKRDTINSINKFVTNVDFNINLTGN